MAREIHALSADLKGLEEFTGNDILELLLEEIFDEGANSNEAAFAFVGDDTWAQKVGSAVDFLVEEGKEAHEIADFQGAANAFWQAAKSLRPDEDHVLLWVTF